ncbi:helix-turn-helix domain-containing protein [Nocardia inohanensis]|uniref:helix-turn-helix domain-containing protein n=1 Tax=Nocardia inohanensis TaxID=209246 RepID=UPI0008314435|nr:hypothetical protein [Nocardia inohanensis]
MSVCARWTGVETRAFREALRLHKESFAEFVGVSYDTVKKWERRGDGIELSPHYAERMDSKLAGADPAVFHRFRAILQAPAEPGPTQVGIPDDRGGSRLDDDECIVVAARTLAGEDVLVAVPRRNFVLGIGVGAVGAAASGALEALRGVSSSKAVAATYASTSIDHIRHFDNLRMSLIESDNVYGAARTLPHVLDALRLLDELKRGKVGDPRGILRMQAMFAETAAWQLQDQRDFARAGHWAAKALQWSHQLADDYYIGLSLVRMSQLACDQGDATEAEELANAAHRSAPGDSLFAAAALTFQAHALALAGGVSDSARTYDMARGIVAVADTDPKWGMFLDHSYIDAYEAHTRAETGEYARATTQFADAMARMQPEYPRDKGVYLARTAVAHMAAGEIEPAVAAGQRALEIGIGTRSARILYKVRELSGMIDPASTQPGVAEFRDAYSAWETASCPDRS